MRRNEKGLFMFAIGCLLAVCMDEAAKRAKREELDEVPFEEEIDEIIEPEEESVESEVEEFEPTPEEIEAAEIILEELLEELEEEEIPEDDEE